MKAYLRKPVGIRSPTLHNIQSPIYIGVGGMRCLLKTCHAVPE